MDKMFNCVGEKGLNEMDHGCDNDAWPLCLLRLSGNPPFYDESDEDDYENHDKNLFRKILAGDYEFDSPYWDEISDSGTNFSFCDEILYESSPVYAGFFRHCPPTAKSLVARLMEVDQDQRLTAQEAINHEW